jgi:hypothetical protein
MPAQLLHIVSNHFLKSTASYSSAHKLFQKPAGSVKTHGSNRRHLSEPRDFSTVKVATTV